MQYKTRMVLVSMHNAMLHWHQKRSRILYDATGPPKWLGCFWHPPAVPHQMHLLHATVVRKIEQKLVANTPNRWQNYKKTINILLGSHWVHRALRSLSMSQQFDNCVAIDMNQKPLVVWPAMSNSCSHENVTLGVCS